MPDFERLMDDLRCDMAVDDQASAYARGYAAGKTRARVEIVVLAIFASMASAYVMDRWAGQELIVRVAPATQPATPTGVER